ncbi:MAG: exodeoxyribonuclease III [Candidatus Aenigmatarchaeota archaeon]
MEIISWNVNGIRAAYEKGLLDFLRERSPDIFCIQEIKADPVDIPSEFKQLSSLEKLGGYKTYWNSSKLRGHRGVGVLTKKKPEEVERKLMGGRFGKDGRVLVLRFSDFTLVNLYLLHGKRDQSRVPKKLDMYKELFEFLKGEERVILYGDFNVAHEKIDLERPEQNHGNTMFLDRERKRIDKLMDGGYVDTFRKLHPDEKNIAGGPIATMQGKGILDGG